MKLTQTNLRQRQLQEKKRDKDSQTDGQEGFFDRVHHRGIMSSATPENEERDYRMGGRCSSTGDPVQNDLVGDVDEEVQFFFDVPSAFPGFHVRSSTTTIQHFVRRRVAR